MTRKADGFTLIEILFVVGIISLIAAMAYPGLQRARLSANASSVMGSMRSINSGQQVFWTTCGNGMYSPSLQNLGAPVLGAAGFVSPELSGPAPIVKSGYEYDMATANPVATISCNGGTTALTYHVTADPLIGGGQRYFGSNGAGSIYESSATLFGVMPDDHAPPAPAVPIQR